MYKSRCWSSLPIMHYTVEVTNCLWLLSWMSFIHLMVDCCHCYGYRCLFLVVCSGFFDFAMALVIYGVAVAILVFARRLFYLVNFFLSLLLTAMSCDVVRRAFTDSQPLRRASWFSASFIFPFLKKNLKLFWNLVSRSSLHVRMMVLPLPSSWVTPDPSKIRFLL